MPAARRSQAKRNRLSGDCAPEGRRYNWDFCIFRRGAHVKRLNLFYLAVFLMQFAGSTGTIGVSLMAKFSFGASVWGLAGIAMTGTLTYTVTCLLLRFVRGRISPKTLSIAGASLYAATYLAATRSTATWHLFLVFFGGGIGSGLFWPMVEAFIARGASGHRASRRMGVFNISWSLGDAVGTVAGGVFFHVMPVLPFVALAATCMLVVASVLVAARLPEILEPMPPGHPDDPRADGAVNARFRRAAWVGNFVASGVTNVLRSVFTAPARDVFRMGGATIGLVIGTFNATRTLMFYAMRRWHKWRYQSRTFVALNSLIAFGMLGVILASLAPAGIATALVFASFAVAGVGAGMTYFSSIFYTVDASEDAQTNTPIHEAVLGAGGAAAAIAAGLTNQLASNALSPLAMCAVAVGLGIFISARHIRGWSVKPNVLEVSPARDYPEGGNSA